MHKIPEAGIVGAQRMAEAAAGEFSQVMQLVHIALAAKLGLMPADAWRARPEAMFADRVIVCRDGRYYAYPYTIGADNQVTIGDATEVIEQYVPVALREAREAQTFTEAKEATGATWDAVVIRAGLSKNNVFYPDAVLREAVPLFEGAKIFAKADAEHLRGDGKDVTKLAGWISAPRFVEGAAPDSGRIQATVNLTAGTLRDTIVDAWQRGKRDLVALSIDAAGTAGTVMREGASPRRVRAAKSITKVNSVDLIVEPGAGGGLVRLVEAAADSQEKTDMLRNTMLEAIKAKKPDVYATLDPATVTDEVLMARYAEAMAPAPAPVTTAAPTGEALTMAQFNEALAQERLRGVARSKVDATTLPAASKEKLNLQFATAARFTEADVDAAITAERAYVVRLAESLGGDAGRVKIEGGDIRVEDRAKRMDDMLDAFFDPAHKEHRNVHSFKECYIEMTGDRYVTGRLENMDRTRMAEAMGASFRESLDSTSFANVLGTSITRRLVVDYREMGQYDIWRNACNVVSISDFRTQTRTRYGGYGNLPTVNEGDPYAAMTSPTDEAATYTPAKRGGTEDVTLEMIKNDDVGAIQRIPVKMSRAAKRTLATFVLDFVRTNPTLYDSVAFFHASHGNLGASALDATSLAASRLRMLKQAELGSADRLGIGPKYIWVPMDLQEAAVNLFNRNTNNDKTFVNAMSLTVMPVWYWTDTNDWALSADPMDIPGIEVGFLDGKEEPELFVQDNPSVGSMFSNDKITYKIRHIYGGNVVEYRGWDKSVV